MRPSVCLFTLLNINISETSGSIATKFYPKHHWGGGKDALGFWPDQIGTLVSMAMDSSHTVINLVSTLASSFLIRSFSYLQVTGSNYATLAFIWENVTMMDTLEIIASCVLEFGLFCKLND